MLFPVLQIDFTVSDVPVTANNKFATTVLEFFQIRKKLIHKAEFGRLTFGGRRAGRRIKGNQAEIFVVALQITAFSIEFRTAKAV